MNISNQRMPNFPAYIQYAWNKSSHIRVAGIVRNMTYENLVAQRAESKACLLYTSFVEDDVAYQESVLALDHLRSTGIVDIG